MEQKNKSCGIPQEWYKSFLINLKKLSETMKLAKDDAEDDMYSSIGTTPESKELITELIAENKEEFTLQRNIEKEKDAETWFKKKVAETVYELAKDGIIEGTPTPADCNIVYNTIKEAMDKRIADEAELTAKELDSETDTLAEAEEMTFNAENLDEPIVQNS